MRKQLEDVSKAVKGDASKAALLKQIAEMDKRLFDVESKIRAAQTLAAALRKVEWLSGNADALRQMSHSGSPVDPRAAATLAARIAGLDGMSALTRSRSPSQTLGQHPDRRPVSRLLVSRLQRVDRYVQALLQSRGREDWLAKYRRLRRRINKLM